MESYLYKELEEYRKTGLTPKQVQALFDENVALSKLVARYIPDEALDREGLRGLSDIKDIHGEE